jgi:hypothetical protein
LRREYASYFRAHRALLAGITVAGVLQSFAYLPLAMLLRRVWFQQGRLRQTFEAFSRGVRFAISALERQDRNLGRLLFRPPVIVVSHEWRILRHAGRAWRLSKGRLVETALELRP